MWLENTWDHRFLAWDRDPVMLARTQTNSGPLEPLGVGAVLEASIVWVPFNPTAENMAVYLLEVVGPARLSGTGVNLVEVRIEETRKCSASATLKRERARGAL